MSWNAELPDGSDCDKALGCATETDSTLLFPSKLPPAASTARDNPIIIVEPTIANTTFLKLLLPTKSLSLHYANPITRASDNFLTATISRSSSPQYS